MSVQGGYEKTARTYHRKGIIFGVVQNDLVHGANVEPFLSDGRRDNDVDFARFEVADDLTGGWRLKRHRRVRGLTERVSHLKLLLLLHAWDPILRLGLSDEPRNPKKRLLLIEIGLRWRKGMRRVNNVWKDHHCAWRRDIHLTTSSVRHARKLQNTMTLVLPGSISSRPLPASFGEKCSRRRPLTRSILA